MQPTDENAPTPGPLHRPQPAARPARPGRRLRRVLGAGAAALALIAATAAGPAAAKSAQDDGDGDDGDKAVLTAAVAQSVDSLSPFLAVTLVATSLNRLMYDSLVNYDVKTQEPIPGLAEKWEPSNAGKTWTYTMRDGVKWSDGKPLTAEDARWTFHTMMTDEAAGAANGSYVANFAKVSAPDARTLVVELKEPQATMNSMDLPIVPKHVWQDVEDLGKFNNDSDFPVVSSGPYILTGFKTDSYVTFEPNPNFWRGKPKFDELTFKYYKETDAAVAALRKGEVSFVPDLTPAHAASLEGQADIKVNDGQGRRFWAIATNPGARDVKGRKFGDGHPALLDPRVREALFLAVDREVIVDKVLQGHGVEGEGYIPPRFGDYHWKPSAEQKIGHDPAKAARLLDQAGYRLKDGKRVGKDGKPLDLRMLCHSTDARDKAAGKFLEEWWGALGIGLDLQCLDNVGDPWVAGEYDLAFDGWSVNPDPDFVLAIHTCAALPESEDVVGQTDNFICNKDYDRLYAEQLAAYDDPEKRAEIVREMQSVLYDTGYMNVLAYPNSVEAYRTDHIESITAMPAGNGNIWGQDGSWSWATAVPAAEASDDDGGSAMGVVLGGGAAVAVVVAAGVVFTMRRRATAEDRE
ncbi:ABC transporter substrate-binding protein [Streptomyces aculeolatus]